MLVLQPPRKSRERRRKTLRVFFFSRHVEPFLENCRSRARPKHSFEFFSQSIQSIMGAWAIAVNCLFPIPLISLLILCLPMPDFIAIPVRKVTNKVLKKVLFAPLLNGFNLYQTATLLSIFLFMEAGWATTRSQDKLDATAGAGMVFHDERLKCMKWRNERNFWIAFMSLVLWLVLYRVHKLTQDLEVYRAEVQAHDKPHGH